MTASELALDDQALARRARTTAAAAEVGVLFTGAEAGGSLAATVVSVSDDDGEPLLGWEADSPAARSAGDGRLATLMLTPNVKSGVRLTLSGRLVLPAVQGVAGATLRVEQVLVGCPYRGLSTSDSGGTRQLSLADYAMAEPDEVAASVPRLVRHLNTGHAEDLRQVAARVSGAGDVAGAVIAELGRDRVELAWVDLDGGHQLAIAFASSAETLTDLVTALRTALREVSSVQ
jgi:hypothetical protein